MSNTVVVGIGGHLVGLDPGAGTELWRTKLKGSDTVTLQLTPDRIFAGASGELFCLDRHSGQILWHNKLKGLGMGLVTFGGDQDAAAGARLIAQRRAAASTAAAAS